MTTATGLSHLTGRANGIGTVCNAGIKREETLSYPRIYYGHATMVAPLMNQQFLTLIWHKIERGYCRGERRRGVGIDMTSVSYRMSRRWGTIPPGINDWQSSGLMVNNWDLDAMTAEKRSVFQRHETIIRISKWRGHRSLAEHPGTCNTSGS